LIAHHFPNDKHAVILDVGCGSGAIVHFAREAGYTRVSGVDRSAEQVAEARRLGIDGVRKGDLHDALSDVPDGSVDLVITFDVIEHLTRRELLDVVDGVYRVIRSGGRWIIHAPNAESPFFGRIRYGDLTHEQAFTRTSIGQLLFTSGFDTVACYEDAPIVHGVASAVRWIGWRAVRSVLRLYLATETGLLREPAIFSQNFLTVARKPAAKSALTP